MISTLAEEYNKVYCYKYRHKIYENTQGPPQVNLNQLVELQRKSINLDNNNYQNNDFLRSRTVFSSYLRRRYMNKENNRGYSNDFQKRPETQQNNKKTKFFSVLSYFDPF